MCLYSYRFTTGRFPRPGEQASAEVNGKIVDHAGQITKQMGQIVISSGIATLDKLLQQVINITTKVGQRKIHTSSACQTGVI